MRNFINIALCYFLGPLAVYAGLKALGAFWGYDYILGTNLLVGILVLFGFLLTLFFLFVRKSYPRALALVSSISIVLVCVWYIGQAEIQRRLYIAEVLTPHFDDKCVPRSGIPLGDDVLWVCRRYEFASYTKLIVKISGAYPAERLADDINSGKVSAPGSNEWWIRPNSVISYPLISDYYLFEVYLCGRGYACGPID